jgi:hypothetical protein
MSTAFARQSVTPRLPVPKQTVSEMVHVRNQLDVGVVGWISGG